MSLWVVSCFGSLSCTPMSLAGAGPLSALSVPMPGACVVMPRLLDSVHRTDTAALPRANAPCLTCAVQCAKAKPWGLSAASKWPDGYLARSAKLALWCDLLFMFHCHSEAVAMVESTNACTNAIVNMKSAFVNSSFVCYLRDLTLVWDYFSLGQRWHHARRTCHIRQGSYMEPNYSLLSHMASTYWTRAFIADLLCHAVLLPVFPRTTPYHAEQHNGY